MARKTGASRPGLPSITSWRAYCLSSSVPLASRVPYVLTVVSDVVTPVGPDSVVMARAAVNGVPTVVVPHINDVIVSGGAHPVCVTLGRVGYTVDAVAADQHVVAKAAPCTSASRIAGSRAHRRTRRPPRRAVGAAPREEPRASRSASLARAEGQHKQAACCAEGGHPSQRGRRAVEEHEGAYTRAGALAEVDGRGVQGEGHVLGAGG